MGYRVMKWMDGYRYGWVWVCLAYLGQGWAGYLLWSLEYGIRDTG